MPIEDSEGNGRSITLGAIAILCLIGVLTALTRGAPTCASESLTSFPCLGWELFGGASLFGLVVDIYAWSRVHSFPAAIDHV